MTTDAPGSTVINTTAITTTGNQTYGDNVTLSSNATLSGGTTGNITFSGTVNGAFSLNVNTGGATSLGTVGNTAALTAISTDAAGTVSLNGTVTTTGAQTYNDPINLTGATTLASTGSGAITLANIATGVNGAQTLAINTDGATVLAGPVGATTALTSLSTSANGTTTISGGSVRTTAAQNYGDNVTLGANTTITAGSAIFGGTVNSDATARSLSLVSGGSVTLQGAVGATNALSSLTTDATGTTAINGGSVRTTGAQSYGDAVTLGGNTTLTSTTAGNITLTSTVSGAASNLTTDSTGTTTFSGAVTVQSLTAGNPTAGGTTVINTTAITTTANQTYNDPVTLSANAVLNAGTGNINFTGAVDAATAGSNSLTLNTSGTATFGAPVGATTALSSVTTDATGTTALNGGSVRTTAAQTYGDAVTLGAASTLTGTNITFNGTVNGGQTLAVNASGITAFNADVGGTTPVTSITTDLTGSTTLNAATIHTSGAQTYNDPVNLGSNVTVVSDSGPVTFANTVNGARDLTVTSPGATVFGGIVGGTAPLVNLTTNGGGTTEINTSGITTTNNQLYGDAVTLGANATLNSGAGNVTFSNTLDSAAAGSFGLTVNSTGDLTLAAVVGGIKPVASLATDAGGRTLLNGGTVTTAGGQTYGDQVSLGANATLASTTSGNISLTTVTGNNFGLTLNTGGTGTLGGAVTGLTTLTTDAGGTTAINSGAVTTSGAQTYNDNITLGANTTLTAAGIAFNGNLSGGANNLTLVSSAPVTQGASSILSSTGGLALTGTGSVNLPNANDFARIAASGGQVTYHDANALTVGTVGATAGINTPATPVSLTTGGPLTIGSGAGEDIVGTTVTLNVAGANQAAGSIVNAANLHLQGTGTINLTEANTVTNLTAAVTGATINYNDADGITIGTGGITTAGGAVTINANGPLVVANNINTGPTGTGTARIGRGVTGAGTINGVSFTAGTTFPIVGGNVTLNRVDVNDEPEGSNNAKTIAQNTLAEPSSHTFAASDFPFSDPIDTPANQFAGVVITTLPAKGTLTRNTVAVTAGDFISKADLDGGLLVYTPAVGEIGNPFYTSFTFQVRDNGGTTGGGQDTDQTANTFSFNVVEKPHEPAGADQTRTIFEDQTYTFGGSNGSDFGFSDPNDSPGHNFLGVVITTLPTNGTLTLSGSTFAAGTFIPNAQILAGNLKFTPAANQFGSPYGTFTFQVRDDGDASVPGAVVTDQSANTFRFDVTSVNDAPSGTNKTINPALDGTLVEDGLYTFTAADFGFSDSVDTPPNSLAGIRITTLPANGTLLLNGGAVNVGDIINVIVATQTIDGQLTFAPTANQSGTNYASFQFQVRDNGGVANGGIEEDPTPNLMTLNVTSKNDPPTSASKTVNTNEDTNYTFTSGDFAFADTNDNPSPNSFANLIITSLPGGGDVLRLGTTAITAVPATIPFAQIGTLNIVPAAGQSGLPHSSFLFRVQDNGLTAQGGVDTSVAEYTISLNVISVNDAPSSADKTINLNPNVDGTLLEDGSYAFTLADFALTDNDPEVQALLAVKITTLQTAGSLRLGGINGTQVSAGQFISALDINNGQLVFVPAGNANGAPYATFTFQVQDNGGTAGGGVDLSSPANTMTLNVTRVNDAPLGATSSKGIAEDAVYIFNTGDFNFSDPSDVAPTNPAGVNQLNNVLLTVPTSGTMRLNGAVQTPGANISVSRTQIQGQLLTFQPAANSTAGVGVSFRVQDDGGTAFGGVDTSVATYVLTLNITSVNDAPIGANGNATVTAGGVEDDTVTFTPADFGFTDPNDSPANAFFQLQIVTAPTNGTLLNGATPLNPGQSVSALAIAAGALKFVPAPNANGTAPPYSSFTFKVQDDGGVANSGQDTDQTARTMSISITPKNDAPSGASRTISTGREDTLYTFAEADFGFTDNNDRSVAQGGVSSTNANGLLNVIVQAAPQNGTLIRGGVDYTGPFPVAIPRSEITTNSVTFRPNLDKNSGNTTPFSLTFQVQDDGGTALGGVDTDPTTRTITFTVASVNDAPVGTPPATPIVISEDGSYVLTVADFGFTDPKDTPANSLSAVRITSVLAGGSVFNGINPVVAGQEVSLASIQAQQLRFVPNANANGAGFGFTFQVKDDGLTANGGVDLDATPRSMLFNVTSVSDAPQGIDKTINPANDNTFLEDTAFTFQASDFGFTDAPENDTLNAVRITTLPLTAAGTLRLGTTPVAANDLIPAAQLGTLNFLPVNNGNGPAFARFTFQVKDNGGTANGGADLDPTPNSMTMNITPVNDRPVGINNSVSTLVNTLAGPYTFSLADFPFSDIEANPLQTLHITAVNIPAGATLTLGGAPVVGAVDVSLAQLTGGPSRLVYTQPGTARTDSLSFQIQDSGGTAFGGQDTDATVRTLTINVSAGANHEPAGQNKSVNAEEDKLYTFSINDFLPFNDNDGGTQSLAAVRISTLPPVGSLTFFNGTADVSVLPGQLISAADIVANRLKFQSAPNFNASPYTSFTFQVKDNGGTALVLGTNGVDLDSTPNLMTVNVLPVNDAPSGADKVISMNEDGAYNFAAADFGLTDPNDAAPTNPTGVNSLAGIVISSLNLNGGTLRISGVDVTVGQPISLAQIPNLQFIPALNANGTNAAQFGFQVRDNGGVALGGIDLDPTPNTITASVASVNDAPRGANGNPSISVNGAFEGTVYTFGLADFGFLDNFDSPANAFEAVRLESLPQAASGSLSLSGNAVASGQTISAAVIAGGQLRFTPAPNAFGSPLASFLFRVQDNGGTANGGVDLDTTPRTLNLNVAPVNNPPQGDDKIAVGIEDTAVVIAATDFGFSDPTDNNANTLAAVRIATLPTAGTLFLGGAPVNVGQFITVGDINSNLLTFVPAPNQSGSPHASFTFQVQDNGGTGAGGSDLDPTPNTLSITIQAVNDAPSGADLSISTLEDTGLPLTAANFGFSDPSDAVSGTANTLHSVLITVPAAAQGTLTLDGVAQTPGAVITVSAADIAGSKLVFTPFLNKTTAVAPISFSVKDNGGTLNGGVDVDPTPNFLTINITAVNDAPVGTSKPAAALEDHVYTLSAADFGFTDPSDTPNNNSLAAVKITAIPGPGKGTLTLAGQTVTANTPVTAAQLAAGALLYTPPLHANGANFTSIQFQVQDDGLTANGGVDLDITARTLTINLGAVNDAPVGQDRPVTAPKNGAYTFGLADFPITDPVDSPANLLASIRIQSLPSLGTLRLGANIVGTNQEITRAEIEGGTLVFTPAPNTSGSPYASFSFFVKDDGGTANDGIDSAGVANTVAISVDNVSQEPAGADSSIGINEDTSYVLKVTDFGFTDPNDTPANSFIAVQFGATVGGTLTNNGNPVAIGTPIPLVNITNGLVRFTPTLNSTATGRVVFQVKDDGGTANGGKDLDSSPNTLTLNITSVNDAPAGASTTVSVDEDSFRTFTAADFGFSDLSDTPQNTLLAVRITTLPTAGTLTLSGNTVVANQSIAVGNLTNLRFTPALNANGIAYSSFTFQVQDNGTTANGGIDLDPVADTITVNVNSVNDEPSGASSTQSVVVSTTYTFNLTDFGFTDNLDQPNPNLLANVIIGGALTGAGNLRLNGVDVSAANGNLTISRADILANRLVYTAPAADPGNTPDASFTFRVQDNGGTALGGVDTDATPNTIAIDVRTGPNQAPTGSDGSAQVAEDRTYTIQVADFGFGDPDSPQNNFQAVKISSLVIPSGGQFTNNSLAVGANDVVPVSDILLGLFRYTPPANANAAAARAEIRFQVQDDGGIISTPPGQDTDQSPNTLVINVQAVSDAPLGTAFAKSTNEDQFFNFAGGDFQFSDAADAPTPNTFTHVVITSVPTSGTLTLGGVTPVNAGDAIPVASLNTLRFTPASNASGTSTFTFQVKDNGGTATVLGVVGQDTDATPKTVTITINAVNDAPVGTAGTVTMFEGTTRTFTEADFGFSDPNDSPGNAFAFVKITTLPTSGTLKLGAANVLLGAEIPVASLQVGAATPLTFTPSSPTFAGNSTFTFQVKDNGGTANTGVDLDVTARLLTITVQNIGTEPFSTVQNNTIAINEDATRVLTLADFNFSDANDTPPNAFAAVIFRSLPTSGSLTNNGLAIGLNQRIPVAAITGGQVRFTPALNSNSGNNPNPQFTFAVEDDGSILSGGVNVDQTPNTITFDVQSVNDAPQGTAGSVTTSEGLDYTFTAGNFGFADLNDTPANTLQSVRIAALSSGSLLLNGNPLTLPATVAASDIGGLVFHASSPFFAGQATFTFQVQDNGLTANGGVDLDPLAKTLTVNVTSVNSAPSGADKTIGINEDQSYPLTAADFGFTDPNDNPQNAFAAVRITTLPTAGSLTLGGQPVAQGAVINVADLGGNLRYLPPLNANGAGLATFTFQVQDNGGGVNFIDPSTNTITFDVASVNDAPSGANNTVVTNEDIAKTFAAADFGFSDPSDNPQNTLAGVRISTLPGSGTLRLGLAAVTAGDIIPVGQIGQLNYLPAQNATGSASFTFQVQDNGLTANGGIDTDQTPNVMNISITSVNDAPSGASNTVTFFENATYVFTAADFGFSDLSDNPANALLQVNIVAVNPGGGTLSNNGAGVGASSTVSAANINAGLFRFTPAANFSGPLNSLFTFQVKDNGGTASSGIDLDPTVRTMSAIVNEVSSAPSGTNGQVTIDEDNVKTFTVSDFGFSDAPGETNLFAGVFITTLPNRGTLSVNGGSVAPGAFIPESAVTGGQLRFTPVAGTSGAPYASFTFQVKDNGGTANGGVDTDPTPNTYTINVNSVNDAPSGQNRNIQILSTQTRTFTVSDFGFSDLNDSPSNAFLSVRIATLPTGTFLLGGAAVTAGQFIPVSSLAVGSAAPLTFSGTADTSFTFQVKDDGGTANNGVDQDPNAKAITIDVETNIVTRAPTANNRDVVTNEDTPYTFTVADFPFTDLDNNNLLSVRIGTPPGAGVLALSGTAVTANQTITAGDITAGKLVFTPLPVNQSSPAFTTLTFFVKDDGGTANGGADEDTAANTVFIAVNPVNDAPQGQDRPVTATEDTAYPFTLSDFPLTDGNDTPQNILAAVRIASLPTVGTLTVIGQPPVAVGTFVSAADIQAGNFRFIPNQNVSGSPVGTFTFQVQDNGGTALGGVDLDPTPNTITINVTGVNDPPVGGSKVINLNEDGLHAFVAGDFGFADLLDNPPNQFANLIILAAPAPNLGQLRFQNVAQSTFPLTIPAGQINQLSFVPTSNVSGNATFSFRVQDNGGTANGGSDTSVAPATITLSIASVNDAPDGANNTVTTLEDQPKVFTLADFNFTDVENNAFIEVRITTLPNAGSLTLNGVAVAAQDSIPANAIAGGQLRFTPAQNAVGPTYAQFQFQVKDNGGTANGGFDLDLSPGTMTIKVDPVPDAPRGADSTKTIQKNETLTLSVSDFGFSDPFDNPANNFQSVTITSLPGKGSLSLGGTAITAVPALITLSQITGGQLRYAPTNNESGANYANFGFQVKDDGGTANGGADTDPTAKLLTINVSETANVPPVGQNITVNGLEDAGYTFAVADFVFTDAPVNNGLAAVRIASLPVQGTLFNNGIAVQVNDFVSRNDLATGRFIYTPPANLSGANFTNFRFQIKDDGGTANGGIDLDQTQRTANINLTAVNDAPSGADNSATLQVNTALTFTTGSFGFSDPNDPTAGHTFQALVITTLPAAGRLTLNGADVNAGQSILATDIAASRLVFTPAAGQSGSPYASFTFQVKDNGGTANNGADLDPTANLFTVNVTAKHTEPQGTSKTISTVNEDQAYTVTVGDFGFSDPGDNDSFLNVRITSLPSAGTLTLSGQAVAAGQVIPVTAITANQLLFRGANNASGTGYASFAFQVQDDGGTANGGADLDSSPNVLTFDVRSVNDAPAGAGQSFSLVDGATRTLTLADFPLTDVNDVPANILAGVKFTALPNLGSLRLNNNPIGANDVITRNQISSGALTYVANGTGTFTFSFQVQDDGGTANGGIDLDPTARTSTINVTAGGILNQAPAGTNKAATVLEDVDYTVKASDFGFTDPNNTVANNFLAVRITTLPTAGTLLRNGVAVNAGDLILVSDIGANLLTYRSPLNQSGFGLASLTFQVKDDGGTATVGGTPGVDLDQTPNTLSFNVLSVNDAPAGTTDTISAVANVAYVFTAADFGFTDANDTPFTNGLAAVKITTLPDPISGTLTNNGQPVFAGEFVSIGNINLGLLRFTPAIAGTAAASFTFQVQDDGGTDNGGVNLDQSANTLTFNVDAAPAVNEAPVGQDKSLNVFEDRAYAFTVADFPFTDSKNHNLLAVKISTVPTSGTLTLNGGTVVAGQSISANDITAGRLQYLSAPNATGAASFTFQVQDNGGTANGGQDTDQSPNSMNITVVNVNDAPSGSNNTITMNEDAIRTLAAGDFGLTDALDNPANTLASVIITTLPGAGSLKLGAANVTAGQEIPLASLAQLTFQPAAQANGNAYASFTFQVKDNGGTANQGIDLDATPNTLVFNVTSVNDQPTATGRTVSLANSTATVASTYAFLASDFGFADANDNPPNTLANVKIITLPTVGSLTLSGVAVAVNQLVSLANIPSLVYTAPQAPTTTGNFTFQVQDNGGTANTGVDLSANATMNFTFSPLVVNQEPSGASNTRAGREDTTYQVQTGDFGFTDPNGNGFLSVRITSLPSAASGVLRLNNNPVAVNDVVQTSDITAGNLLFVPAADSTTSATIGFQVKDNGGTANGGQDTDQSANTLTITLASVNDEPSGNSTTATGFEDQPLVFNLTHFTLTDTKDTPANTLAGIKIASLPASGSLTFNGGAVTVGQSISRDEIAAGALRYTGVANASGLVAGFGFQVQDNGGTANGGVDTDQTPNTIGINLTAVNDAPSTSDRLVNRDTGAVYTFAASDFVVTDVNDTPPNVLAGVRLTSLPSNGTLQIGATTPQVGDIITKAQLDSATVRFTPNAGFSGIASFSFQVQDNGGTANGGIDLSDAKLFQLNYTGGRVNTAPSGTSQTLGAFASQPRTLTVNDFGFSDSNQPADQLKAVLITTTPTGGTLTNSGSPVNAGNFISVSDIASGRLLFNAPSTTGNVFFTFQVQDDGGTAGGGVDLDQSANTLAFTVLASNQAPSGGNATLGINEDAITTLTPANFGFSDADGNNFAGVFITAITAGSLTEGGVPVAPGSFIAASSISGNLLRYTPPANLFGNNLASISFQVKDDGGTANGGQDTDQTANSITFNVTEVNDAPSFTAGPDATGKDNDGVLTIANWAKNITSGPANETGQTPLSFEVTGNTNPGLFTSGPSIDPVTGNLTFDPAPNAHGTAQITVRLKDSGGTAAGGADTSATQTFNITIDKPFKWHNTRFGLDVTNSSNNGTDNQVTANDALQIINFINAFGAGRIMDGVNRPFQGGNTEYGPLYYDTANSSLQPVGDNFVTAGDVLAIINYINANGAGGSGPAGEGEAGGEGEGEGSANAIASDSYFQDLGGFGWNAPAAASSVTTVEAPAHEAIADILAILAADAAEEQLRRRRLAQ